MENQKSQIQVREKHKRRVFLVKVLIYVLLFVYGEFFARIINFPTEEIKGTVHRIYEAATFFLASNILISLGRMVLVRFYLRKHHLQSLHTNFVLGVNRIASILNGIIFLISLMLLFGINPFTFFTSITIVAAAIALLSKDYITNMINGLIIMFSDQLTLGDNVKIGDQKGKILDVTLINLVLLNEDDDVVMIPNNTVLTSQVINHSRQYIKKLSFEFEVKPGKLNLDHFEQELRETLNQFEEEVTANSFSMKTVHIQKDAVKLKCQFLLNNNEKQTERIIKRKVNQKIIELSNEIQ
ncbi:mechanosensitive ion channel [Litoribacter ruber]|uniref:Mechanosensitive ion channel n=1 Tax=Litoribacter ruber TaxID=702568 RepID=A0AAP2CEW0_9BACT|nr:MULTISPECIES: mechanosensitive ion channel domain-containing protein [Litoribacter]MBS9522557.1 mechanosensitive ion channel [Litoribacter alkaliphilus]MBT0811088.1 mechanosensitive ion channel [Litoribacter ruber]